MTHNEDYWNHQLAGAGQLPAQSKGGVESPQASQPVGSEAPVSQGAGAVCWTEAPWAEQPAASPAPLPAQSDSAAQPGLPESAEQPEEPGSAAQPEQAAFAAQPAQAAQPEQSDSAAQPAQAAPPAQPAAAAQPGFAASAAGPARPAGFKAAQPQAPAGAPGSSQPASAYAAASHYQPAPAQKSKGGRGWIVAIVFIVLLFAFMAFCFKTCADSMSSLSDLGTSGGSSLSGLSGDAVAVLELDGTIQYDGSACSPEGLKKLLDEAQSNDYVKALVIRVNSGGGTATAGEEMAEYLRQFEKPVVVSSASINASAAYEISAQADYIYVAKSTEIGAIGTVMQVTDLSGLFEKLGIKMETIASADSKDSSYGYRPLTDDEREYYQNMIDQINDLFIENVAEGRHMDVEKVRKLATGLVFTGVDAVENGLADEVGTREDAIKKAAELAGISDYTTASLSFSTYDLSELAYLFGEDRSEAEELLELLHRSDGVQLTH